jgi:hypothetical protein
VSYFDFEHTQRRLGYADGKAGLGGRYSDQHYQRGYREGLRALQAKRLPVVNIRFAETHEDDSDYTFDNLTNQMVYIGPQEKPMATRKQRLFVAVVFAERKQFNGLQTDSLKSMGEWSSFIGTTQDEAVRKALDAREKWDNSPIDRAKYVVLVGEITAKVKPRAAYDLVTLA